MSLAAEASKRNRVSVRYEACFQFVDRLSGSPDAARPSELALRSRFEEVSFAARPRKAQDALEIRAPVVGAAMAAGIQVVIGLLQGGDELLA